jgi:hypothetical protein
MPSRLLDARRNVPRAPRWPTDRVVAAAPRTGVGAPMHRLYSPKCLEGRFTRSHLINTVQVMQEAAVAHTESAPKRRETATYSGSQCAEYSSETIYEIGSSAYGTRETVESAVSPGLLAAPALLFSPLFTKVRRSIVLRNLDAWIGPELIHHPGSLCTTTTYSPRPCGWRGQRSHSRGTRAAFYASSCKRTSENSPSTHLGE